MLMAHELEVSRDNLHLDILNTSISIAQLNLHHSFCFKAT